MGSSGGGNKSPTRSVVVSATPDTSLSKKRIEHGINLQRPLFSYMQRLIHLFQKKMVRME